MNKQKILKIVVPLLIIAVIAGIWVVKNKSATEPLAPPAAIGNEADMVQPNNDTDFVLEATSVDLDTLTSYGLPLIIDFGSDSCIPCKEMAPVLQTANAEMQGKAIVKFVDVWKNPDAAKDFPVQVIPTQVLITADGMPYAPSDEVSAQIQFTQYNYKDNGELAFTVHQGGLTEEQMKAILKDMGVE